MGSEKKSNGNSLRIVFGFIVIGIIIVNIWLSISKFKSNTHDDEIGNIDNTITEVIEEPVYDYNDGEISNVTPLSKTNQKQQIQNTDLSDIGDIDLVYQVDGCTDPEYYWVISITSGKKSYDYLIVDPYTEEWTISKSGKWYIQTFGKLKAEHPSVRLRNRNLSPSKQIIMLGSVGSYGGRVVDGIIVPSGKYAELYFNDDDDPMEFFLIDRLVRLD